MRGFKFMWSSAEGATCVSVLSKARAAVLLLLPLLVMHPRHALAGAEASDSLNQRGTRLQQETAPPVDSLIQLAFAHAPSVAILRERLEAARQMARVPGLPNPVLEVMTQDAGFPKWTVGSMEMSMVQIGLTQSFPSPGRVGARKAVARAEADEQSAELERARREVASQVRAYYGQLYALDREREVLDSGTALLKTLAQAAMDRYRADRTEQEAVLKAQLSSSRLVERGNDLDAERAGTLAALNEILDISGEGSLGRVASLPDVQAPAGWGTDVSGDEALAVRGSPEVRAMRAAVEAAERRVRLSRTGYWPELMAGGDLGLRGKLDPVVGFRLGITLPLWETRRTRFEVQAAEADLRAAQEEERGTEARVRAAAARLGAEWRRSEEQIRLYKEALIPQSQAALDAAQVSFLADRIQFSTVIEDFQMWLEAHAQLASREAERFRTWAEMRSLVGEGTQVGQ